jgi:RNA polymerase sigma-70 factor, ECF subfamily
LIVVICRIHFAGIHWIYTQGIATPIYGGVRINCMDENEKLLLSSAKKGDIEAFEKLTGQYRKKIYNIALRMTGNREDASDLAQEVLIKVYKSLRSFREESSFSTWVYRITKNLCIDEFKKQSRRKTVSLDENVELKENTVKRQVESDEPGPYEQYEKSEIKRIVTDAIGALSEEHRMVIILRDLQGFSYEEISKIVKCPEGTVKSRINRARQALKELLGANRELLGMRIVK